MRQKEEKKSEDKVPTHKNGISHGSLRFERRRFGRQHRIGNRIDIRPLGQRPGLEVKLGADLINISDGGLCLSQDIEWNGDQVLKLVLPVADWSTTIPTLGEVRWVKRMDLNEGRFMIGIQYLF